MGTEKEKTNLHKKIKWKKTKDEEEEEDPFDSRIQKSGCADLHYALLDCFQEHKDWRKCQDHVKAFKECIDQQNKQKKS
ncbi:Cytochrome oxidase assembly factor4 [Porites harrisoni]